jgi:hypothetical protein
MPRGPRVFICTDDEPPRPDDSDCPNNDAHEPFPEGLHLGLRVRGGADEDPHAGSPVPRMRAVEDLDAEGRGPAVTDLRDQLAAR